MRSIAKRSNTAHAARARGVVTIVLALALYCTPLLIEAAPDNVTRGVAATAPSEKALPGLLDVLDDLRKGGFVIYFRHATTEQSGASDEGADLHDCKTQRNL